MGKGKRNEAHELLADIDGWFTEGFDTADLQKVLSVKASHAMPL